jgi:methylenetetrahydrofolate--tRNA-(uracil-5-)-methyltransferase
VAELVCSNSLKSDGQENAHGLLKAELRVLGSALLECAERARVPGGKALVVDRRRFSAEVQSELSRAGVSVERAEVSSLPPASAWYRARSGLSDPHQPTVTFDRPVEPDMPVTVIATGPLTSPLLAEALRAMLGTEHLFLYDAIAPIVAAESLDISRVFEGSRYGAGSDYLNCPMNEGEYDRFVTALLGAEVHPIHSFDKPPAEDEIQGDSPRRDSPRISSPFFEGCLPVEEIARRGRLALAFGSMKPVGLADPRTCKRPFAVVQLRRENAEGTMYNLVGFQTRLKQGEQERVFRMIPGLEKVRFLRFGSIHRNTFVDSPKLLLPTLQTRASSDLLVAGQLTGVEGYVESIGAGLVAGINASRLAGGDDPLELPRETMLGSLLHYITSPSDSFQPMNANFGLLPPISGDSPTKRLRGRVKRSALAERALEAARGFALTVAENRA